MTDDVMKIAVEEELAAASTRAGYIALAWLRDAGAVSLDPSTETRWFTSGESMGVPYELMLKRSTVSSRTV